MYKILIASFYFLHLTLCEEIYEKQKLEKFKRDREVLLRKEKKMFLGSEINLNQDEQFANVYLMRHKIAELDEAFLSGNFLPAKSFISAREDIESSKVFKFIKMMPKGAALHTHHISLGPIRWVISNLTYRDDLFMRIESDESLRFGWFSSPPAIPVDGFEWKKVSEARSEFGPEVVDQFFRDHLTCRPPDDQNINVIWKDFKRAVKSLRGILSYLPAFQDYLYASLKELHRDGIQHVQIRTTLFKICRTHLSPESFDCQSFLTELESASVFKEITDKFEKENSDSFCGSSLIVCKSRKETNENISHHLELTGHLQTVFPDFVVGFDIVGQEDLGRPLSDFTQELIGAKEKYPNLRFFFHAGETDWHGSTSDMNLIDAILLNATRIGHGYSIAKHPEVKKLAIERNIPIEVCPISNQVLGLVSDLRNHPATTLIQESFPIVLASDDMATWEAEGLSDDFYEAFMGMTSKTTDLRFLKKLIFNSVSFSALSEKRKSKCLSLIQKKWFDFMKTFRL